MRTIEEIRDAAGRLHATAWYGRRIARDDNPKREVARFSLPRQPTDDDEVVYAAVDELERLRRVAAAAEDLLKDSEAADDGNEYTVNAKHGSLFKRLREALAGPQPSTPPEKP